MRACFERGERRRRRVGHGFTLIELLLVMVIIAIMAAVVVPRIVGRGEQAKQNAAFQQVKNFKTMLVTFEVDNGHFPSTEEGLQALIANPGNLPNWKRYMDSDKLPLDPWGRPYVYQLKDNGNGEVDPLVYSCGPSGQDQQGNGDNIKG